MNHRLKAMNKTELGKRILEAAYLTGDFTLRSGRMSKYYLDKYLFETKPEILKPLAQEITKMLPLASRYDRLAGPELGAIALVTAVGMEAGKPFIFCRKEAKEYGTAKLFEGTLNPGEKIILIEDVITSGGQAIKSARALKEFGAEVLEVIGVIDRQEGGREAIEKADLKFRSVFTKSELGI
jgi:orotate phosphoribosyltransferase